MKDFYGNEYVQSGWWWPFSLWFGKTTERALVLGKWLGSVSAAIQARASDAEVKIATAKVGPGDIVWSSLKVRIKSIGGLHVCALGGSDYDTLTKSGKDPAQWVISELAGQKWLTDHGVRPPADYGWED